MSRAPKAPCEGWSYGTAITYMRKPPNRPACWRVTYRCSDLSLRSPAGSSIRSDLRDRRATRYSLSTQIVGDQHHAKASALTSTSRHRERNLCIAGRRTAPPLHSAESAAREAPTTRISAGLDVGRYSRCRRQSAVDQRRSYRGSAVRRGKRPRCERIRSAQIARATIITAISATTNPDRTALATGALAVAANIVGTGFRAPTLYDLFTPVSYGGSPSADQRDPLRCAPSRICPRIAPVRFSTRFARLPRKSEPSARGSRRQFNAGVVWEPVTGLSLSSDYLEDQQERRHRRAQHGGCLPRPVRSLRTETNIIRGPVDSQFSRSARPGSKRSSSPARISATYALRGSTSTSKWRASRHVDRRLRARTRRHLRADVGPTARRNQLYVVAWPQPDSASSGRCRAGSTMQRSTGSTVAGERPLAELTSPATSTPMSTARAGRLPSHHAASAVTRSGICRVATADFRATTIALGVKNVDGQGAAISQSNVHAADRLRPGSTRTRAAVFSMRAVDVPRSSNSAARQGRSAASRDSKAARGSLRSLPIDGFAFVARRLASCRP